MVGNKAASSLGWSGISTVINFITQILVIGFLTAFLTKEEFGRVSILFVVYGLFQLFSGLGLSNYIISQANITKKELNNIFLLNIGFIVVVVLVTFFLSHFLESYFNTPGIGSLVQQLSITFIFLPPAVFYSNLLRRNLSFKQIAIIEIVTRIIWGSAIVLLAFYGYNAQSFVYASIIQWTIAAILFTTIGLKSFRPSFSFDLNKMKEMGKYGAFQMGEAFMNYFSKEADKIIIGNVLGIATLGVYSVYRDILFRMGNLIVFTFNRVYVPILSKNQKDKLAYTSSYRPYLNFLVFTLGIVYATFYLARSVVTGVIINEPFDEYAYLIPIFCCFFFLRFSSAQIATVWLSNHRVDIGFKWNLMLFIVNPLFIYFISRWGISTMLIGQSFLQFFLIVFSFAIIRNFAVLSIEQYLRPVLVMLVLLVCSFWISEIMPYYFQVFQFRLSITEIFLLPLLMIIFIFAVDKNIWTLIKKKVNGFRSIR